MDINHAIDRFITSRTYNYALMINGTWGSGKTYYVKEVLMPHIKDGIQNDNVTIKPEAYYISLYGIKTTDEISQMLCAQAVKSKLSDGVRQATDSRRGQIVTNITSFVMKPVLNAIGLSREEITGVVNSISDYDNSVIIFDDLERCNCEINEVLGFINGFVEHSKASIILVANENEIGKWQLERNPEVQMMIAAEQKTQQQDNLKTQYGEKDDDQNQPRNAITPEAIEQRRNALINNSVYKKTKEKIIGTTINYEPNLTEVFGGIINDRIKPESFKNELLSDLEWYVKIAEIDKHRNIRTFQYFLEKATIVFREILESNPKYNELTELKQSIYRYTYRSSVRYMKGVAMPVWNSEYGEQEFCQETAFDLEDKLFGFKFIDELIVHNTIDATYVNRVLSHYVRMTEKKGKFKDDPYRLLSTWKEAEDDQVNEWLDKIQQNISDGRYSIELTADIVNILAEIRSHDVMVQKCNMVLEALEKYEDSIWGTEQEDTVEWENIVFIEFNREAIEFYGDFVRSFKMVSGLASERAELRRMEKEIDDTDHWASNIRRLMKNYNSERQYLFISHLSLAKNIIEAIEKSDNHELYQLHTILRDIFHNNAADYKGGKKDDYEKSLNYLQWRMNEQDGPKILHISDWGEIKKAIYRLIEKDISTFLEEVRRKNTDIS